MSLKDTIKQDYLTAYKAKEETKVSVLRMLQSNIKNVEIDKKEELLDEDIVKVVQREIKQRRDSIESYKSGKRDDLAKKEEDELEVLVGYLPKQLSDEDVEKIVKEVISQVGANSKADFGKVMGAAMPKVAGKADGNKVSGIVNKLLS